MLLKKELFVLVVITITFCFISLVAASDAKTTEVKQETGTEVKVESGTDVKSDTKTEEQAQKTEAISVKKININKANALELSSVLKKVGPKYAEAIVKYREENGEFQSPEDIMKVKGIGKKIFELNKDVIVVKD